MEAHGAEAVVPSLWELEAANVMAHAEARGLLTVAPNAAFLKQLWEMTTAIGNAPPSTPPCPRPADSASSPFMPPGWSRPGGRACASRR